MIKRITALTLAMLIFTSFGLSQVSAQNIFYEWAGPVDTYYFDPPDDGSFARVSGTVLGWNEDTYTDFLATTRVYRDIESDYDMYDDCRVKARTQVGVYYEGEGLSFSVYSEYVAQPGDLYAEAVVDGMDLIDMDHGIDIFSSNHEIFIGYYNGGVYVIIDQIGDMITIGTSY